MRTSKQRYKIRKGEMNADIGKRLAQGDGMQLLPAKMRSVRKLFDIVPARYVLALVVLLSNTSCFMVRVNMSLAILVMAGSQPTSMQLTDEATNATSDSQATNYTSSNMTMHHAFNKMATPFEWNEMVQGMILSSFYWGYTVANFPGGRMADIWGTKKILLTLVLGNAILSVLTPFAAHTHWGLLVTVRGLQGTLQGMFFPSLHPLIAKWIPCNERSLFFTVTALGGPLSTLVTLPICGIALDTLGWEAVFYITGCLGLLWITCGWFFMFDSPDQHPRISYKEKEFLEQRLGTRDRKQLRVPWAEALKSPYVWILIITATGSDWGFFTFLTLVPKYMQSILHFDIKQNGLLSALPYFCRFIFSISFGFLVDNLLRGKFKLLTLRKLAVFVSTIVPAVGLIVFTLVGTSPAMSVSLLMFCITLTGAVTSGHFQGFLDISPNFSGTLYGLGNGLGSATGIISPIVAGSILEEDPSVNGWRIVFYITTVMYVIAGCAYLLFGTTDVQPWNDVPDQEKKAESTDVEKSVVETQLDNVPSTNTS